MSFNRLKYDEGECKKQTTESASISNYVLQTPLLNDQCFQTNSLIRPFMTGNAGYGNADVESELRGLNRRLSNCPSDKFIPDQKNGLAGSGTCDMDVDKRSVTDCTFPTEETRSENPPSTLRGKDTLRLEPITFNPQDNVRFTNIGAGTRMSVKDAHRPCLPDLTNMFSEFME